MEKSSLTEREKRRFALQTELPGIGLQGQEKIKKTSILVVGAGGKGTVAMKALITSGIGFLGVSDDTLVDEPSLSRQSLYNDNDIGKQKAIVSKQYLQARNNETKIKIHNIRLTSENLNTIAGSYDLILDATNNFDSHFAICEAAKDLNIPLVFGHIQNNKGYVLAQQNIEKCKMQKVYDNTELNNTENQDIDTPLVITNSIVGNILANEAVNLILNRPSQLGNNMLIIKVSDYTFSFQPL